MTFSSNLFFRERRQSLRILHKIKITAFIASTVNYYFLGQIPMAMLSAVLLLAYYISDYHRMYILARPSDEEIREKAHQMRREGRSADEVIEFIKSEEDPDSRGLNFDDVPDWLNYLIFIIYCVNIVLLLTGIILRVAG